MDLKGYIENMRSKPYGRPLLHVLFWLFFFMARNYIGFIAINNYPTNSRFVALISLSNVLSTMVVFYPLVYIVWPYLFAKRRYILFIFSIFGLLILYTFLDLVGEMLLLKDADWAATVMRTNPAYAAYLKQGFIAIILKRVLTLGIVYQLFVFIALPLAIKLGLAYWRQQILAAKLAKDNLQLELDFLRSQVNPHFLFNTLNNVYSLILHDKKEASAEAVAKLSGFMRYSLYDAQAEKMPLDTEVRLMDDYIALERLRINHTTVNWVQKMDRPHHQLPPLLFMPLIENAFKYNHDSVGTVLDIQLHVNENELRLTLENSFDAASRPQHQGGIGNNNFKKRLEHYYAGKSSYNVSCEGGVYSVQVTIDLS